jgi:hypothetical protein
LIDFASLYCGYSLFSNLLKEITMLPGLAGLAVVGVRCALASDLGVPGRLPEGIDRGEGREMSLGLTPGEFLGDGLGEIGLRESITCRADSRIDWLYKGAH